MNTKFYLSGVALLGLGFFSGFFVGRNLGYQLMLNVLGNPAGEGIVTFLVIGTAIIAFSSISGLFFSFILIERLGRKWGPKLNFGSHPVLKLTGLSFLTFLGLLILLLYLLPTQS